jgi:predicted phosphodiesterase
MKLQYISDTHLEYYSVRKFLSKNIIKKMDDCENICLLGDIGLPGTDIYNEFIKYCSDTWKNVFLLYGNHEYYQKSNKTKLPMTEINNMASKLPSNVYFLNNNCIYINKSTNQVIHELIDTNKENYIKIIGSTLWSDIDLKITKVVNDYKFIYTSENILLTPNNTKQFFKESKNYILKELEEEIECILLTHHGVHELANGFYQGNFMQSGYTTNIEELLKFKNLIVCINGHTHSSINVIIPDTSITLLSNCYGYKSECKKIVKYDMSSIFEIN